MFFTPVYYPAVIAAAISGVITGYLWYAPTVFGTAWKTLSGISKRQEEHNERHMLKHFAVSLLTAGIRAYIIAAIFNAMLVAGPVEGLITGILLWLGFAAAALLPGVLYQNVPWKLFLINSGYHLVSIAVMSVMLATWV